MRVSAKVDRQFKKRLDGLYQELLYHLVCFEHDNGTVETKIDKIVPCGIYREGTVNDHSVHGIADWTNPQDGVVHRLVAVTPLQGR